VRNAAIEELTDGAALIVEEPAGLADAMRRVEHEPGLRDRLGAAGLERAAAFTWQRSARAHIKAYTLARDLR
jgi:glycosyltransferase involved in cell wall biosynthesis